MRTEQNSGSSYQPNVLVIVGCFKIHGGSGVDFQSGPVLGPCGHMEGRVAPDIVTFVAVVGPPGNTQVEEN